jgi:hypothetical protein
MKLDYLIPVAALDAREVISAKFASERKLEKTTLGVALEARGVHEAQLSCCAQFNSRTMSSKMLK